MDCLSVAVRTLQGYRKNLKTHDGPGSTLTLTQNERSGSKSLIVFEVMFSKQCQFKPNEIEIIWDESFPAQKFPEQF